MPKMGRKWPVRENGASCAIMYGTYEAFRTNFAGFVPGMVQNGPEKARMGQIGSDWAKLDQNGPEWAKISQKWAKIGQKWAKNGRRARIKRQAPSFMAYTKHFAGIPRVFPCFFAENMFFAPNSGMGGRN